MKDALVKHTAKFGTLPVFLTTISTILGAIMFLRFGYAVGHVGFWGAIAIIVIGHIVTIPTAMAVAEIATNQKVEGGGAYYIISRSFGLNIGAAIGIALYLSQAISVAFYVIAFAEAFDPLIQYLNMEFAFPLIDHRFISVPAMLLLSILILTRGANQGMQLLYFVVAILFLSILFFFTGTTDYDYVSRSAFSSTVENPDNFFYVFMIIFPAFTGIIAGLGLSGDLKDPKKSIPLGTLTATILGMFVYIAIAYKLTVSVSPEDLANDQLIMSKIASWGPIIPIGLAAATISSAIGSILVAPRTLHAISSDKILPLRGFNTWLRKTKKGSGEPINADIITCVIGFFFVFIGDVNFVAEIISMFFMVTYGSICLISFLEHTSADPAYRPTFKSRWYISVIGALACFWLMFQMNGLYAFLSLVIMTLTYVSIAGYQKDNKQGLQRIFQGLIFQVSRKLQVFLQKTGQDNAAQNWRPSVVCVSKKSFDSFYAFNLLRWISHRYGFGTYIHLIDGLLSNKNLEIAKEAKAKLIKLASASSSNVYLDTIISPSYTSAIAQVLQLPSVSGKDNNMLLFEYAKDDTNELVDMIENFDLFKTAQFDVCVLGTTQKGFGYKSAIHIWITPDDYKNANLMILMGYIFFGHPEWKNAEIRIFSIYPKEEMQHQRSHLLSMIKAGRLPISAKNIELIPHSSSDDKREIINNRSAEADLTIMGFNTARVAKRKELLFQGYDNIGNVLFVNSREEITIE